MSEKGGRTFLKKVSKNPRVKRALKQRESKIEENVKKSLVIKGPKVSEIVTEALKDWHKLKGPDSKLFLKKNVTRPFEDQASVEFLAKVNDSSLFAFGCHAKKKPHCLTLGRLFDGQVRDMVELTIDENTFQGMRDWEGERKSVVRYNSKPMFIFNGDGFETNPDLVIFKSLLLDYFRGEVMPKINLAGLDRVIVCTAADGKIFFRHFGILLKKSSDSKLPRVELDEVGPRMDFTLRRTKQAAEDLLKQSMKQAKITHLEKKKSGHVVTMDTVGEKFFLERQDYTKVALTKPKGLQNKRKHGADEDQYKSPASGFGPTKGPKPKPRVKKARKDAPAAAATDAPAAAASS